jgi:hypothetical protein
MWNLANWYQSPNCLHLYVYFKGYSVLPLQQVVLKLFICLVHLEYRLSTIQM